MAISNIFLTKFSNTQKKRDLFDEFLTNTDSDQETPIVLNKDLPTKEEYEAKIPTSPSGYRDTMKAKIVDGDSNYTWQDAKQITVDRAKQQDYELKLRSDALGENKNKVVNSNKPVLDADWPGMGQLKCPTPADGRFVATGNGKGGEIFSRSQIKMATQVSKPRMNHNQYQYRPGMGESLWDFGGEMANVVGSITPMRFTYNKAKEGPGGGAFHGAWSHGLLGAILGAAYNKWGRRRVVVKKDPKTGELYEDYEDADQQEDPMWKDILIGTTIGTGIGGLSGYSIGRDLENGNDTTKVGSHIKHAFAMGGVSDPLVALNSSIMSDSSLDFEQRRALMNYIKTLPDSTLNSLLPTIGSLIGAGSGAVIARKLLGLGFGGSVLGALLGGMMGRGVGFNLAQNSQPMYNPLAGSGFSDTFGFKL